MLQNCKDILTTQKIISIFKGNNIAEQTQLRQCISNHYQTSLFKSVPIYNTSVPSEILIELAQEIFSTSINTFQLQVADNKFDPAKGDIGALLYTIFKNAYLNRFSTEIKKYQYRHTVQKTNTSETYVINLAEQKSMNSISYTTMQVLQQTGQPCKDYLMWFYLEDMSIKEISIITGKTEKGIKHQLYRCRNYFKTYWQAAYTNQ